MRVSREVLLLIVVFAVFGALYPLLALRRRTQDPVSDCSTYRTNATGTKALFTALRRLGLPVARHRRAALRLPDDASVLCILSPTAPIEPDEAAAIREWVRSGGTLVVGCSRPTQVVPALAPGDPHAVLLASVGLEPAEARGLPGSVFVTSDAAEVANVRRIETPSRWRIRRFGDVLVADGAGAILTRVRLGRGAVIGLSDPVMFGNAWLSRADNAVLAADILFAHGRGGTVYFDEYHHGFTEGVGLLELLARTGMARALFPACLAIGLALIAAGRRFGVARAAPRRGRKSAEEFVRAMAGLYQDAGRADVALGMLWEGSRRGLSQDGADGRDISEEELVEIAQRLSQVEDGADGHA